MVWKLKFCGELLALRRRRSKSLGRMYSMKKARISGVVSDVYFSGIILWGEIRATTLILWGVVEGCLCRWPG